MERRAGNQFHVPHPSHRASAPRTPTRLARSFDTRLLARNFHHPNPTINTPTLHHVDGVSPPKRVTHERAALVNGGMFRSCACEVMSAREGSGHVVVLVVFGGDHVVTLLWSLEVTGRNSVHTCEQG